VKVGLFVIEVCIFTATHVKLKMEMQKTNFIKKRKGTLMILVKNKNQNFIPFFILLFIHTFMLVFTFYKKKDWKSLTVLLLTGMGLCFLFEYFVLSLFKAYRYKPKVFVNKDLDNFLGAILSQAVFIPFTAIFLTAFKLGWKGKLFFSLFFSSVEKLFLYLKIHKNNWWKTRYTLSLIPVFFTINDLWYRHLRSGTPIVQFCSLFLSILAKGLFLLYFMPLLQKFRFGLGRWHTWKEHFEIAPLYSIAHSFITAVIIKKDSSLKGVVMAFSFVKLMDLFVTKTRFVKRKFSQSLINNSIHILMILWAAHLKKWIYKDILKVETSKTLN
jgi:hypothetical protein